ncbi:hypothetical protein I551_0568 [Mycobacterium ulcerans str. Harvey]|uniref:Uncharacterized protein n=1 Tax=Mycobacterium ulcerans str. Harvey TaxID=1299332 RepID=A0ABN0R7L5_MYCUL|nr:hypothetical protein I551_0568 [Mycobacterium ulcerans str. Harvey]
MPVELVPVLMVIAVAHYIVDTQRAVSLYVSSVMTMACSGQE